ncbi:O-antigen translocase [Flavobacterium sp. TBRC 19031]|uniref:O-antigen translocase n=1 Tax=Flavobacterium mekongense TaxID=3379707 RepID=UPI0039996A89
MEFFNQILKKELFKVTSLNGISVLVKIVTGFVTSKIIAVFLGPSGMALVGNFRNFITAVENIGTVGFQNGIIKYVADYHNKEDSLKSFLATVTTIIFIVVLLLLGVLFFTADYWNVKLFGAHFQYDTIFKTLAFCLPWYIGSILLTSVLNGLEAYGKVIQINIIGNVLGMLLSLGLIYQYKEFGALLAIVMAPTIVFLVTVFYLYKKLNYFKISFSNLNSTFLKNLSEYSLMALVSAVLGPIVLLSLRNTVIHTISYEAAGYWEALVRISSYYFLFLSTILTVYYLPKLSKSESEAATKKLFWSYFKGIIPFFIIGLVVLYFSRVYLIPLLFSHDFQPVSDLFFWQFIGDVFKAISLILGYQFFAKKLTKAFIISEVFSFAVLWISGHYLMSVFGIEGIVMANAVTYAVYLITLTVYFRKSLF